MRQVRIADLKARLSAHLRAVRHGDTLTVLDRDTPIARIVPIAPDAPRLKVRRPSGPLKLRTRLRPIAREVDVVQLLLEDRARR